MLHCSIEHVLLSVCPCLLRRHTVGFGKSYGDNALNCCSMRPHLPLSLSHLRDLVGQHALYMRSWCSSWWQWCKPSSPLHYHHQLLSLSPSPPPSYIYILLSGSDGCKRLKVHNKVPCALSWVDFAEKQAFAVEYTQAFCVRIRW